MGRLIRGNEQYPPAMQVIEDQTLLLGKGVVTNPSWLELYGSLLLNLDLEVSREQRKVDCVGWGMCVPSVTG